MYHDLQNSRDHPLLLVYALFLLSYTPIKANLILFARQPLTLTISRMKERLISFIIFTKLEFA